MTNIVIVVPAHHWCWLVPIDGYIIPVVMGLN
jgi:hypothetical protein